MNREYLYRRSFEWLKNLFKKKVIEINANKSHEYCCYYINDELMRALSVY